MAWRQDTALQTCWKRSKTKMKEKLKIKESDPERQKEAKVRRQEQEESLLIWDAISCAPEKVQIK
jgi:hypothetical protein